MPVKSTTYVFSALLSTQARLCLRVSVSPQGSGQQRNVQYLADIIAQFTCLVKATFYHSQVMQWYGNQLIRMIQIIGRDIFAQQVTQNPACCKLALEFE